MENVTSETRAAAVQELTAGDWKQMEISAISQVKDAKRMLAAAETLYSRAKSMVNSFGWETEQDIENRKAQEKAEEERRIEEARENSNSEETQPTNKENKEEKPQN